MKAIVKETEEKGAVLKEMPVPKARANEVLLKVKMAAICGTDVHIYNWTPYAKHVKVPLPLIFGHEFSGEVVKVGENVSKIKVGDVVAGETHIPCENCYQCLTGAQHRCQNMKILGVHVNGAFTEYIAIPEICAWKLPAGTPFEIGAIYEPLGVAVHALYVDRIAAQTVAVFGCGPIGLFAIGLSKLSGATEVIGVDIVDERLDIARRMGATTILNPQKDSVREEVLTLTEGRGVDVFIELSGSPQAVNEGFSVLRKGGRVTLAGLPSSTVELDLVNNIIYKEAKIYGITGREMFDTWYKTASLLQSGKFDPSPVITDKFPLSEFSQAINLAESARGGKILIEI